MEGLTISTERASAEVYTRAQGVAQQAEAVYRAIGKADPGIGDLRHADTEGGLRGFEARVKSLQAAVRNAIDLYLSGNTLVLDLIVKFQLGKKALRHVLPVALAERYVTQTQDIHARARHARPGALHSGRPVPQQPVLPGHGVRQRGSLRPGAAGVRAGAGVPAGPIRGRS